MLNWSQYVLKITGEIDRCIQAEEGEALTLQSLAGKLGFSESYTSRRFREVSGLTLKDYIRTRKLAFALKELRDTRESIMQIAVKYGFSSHEAFTRAFRKTFGVSPVEYRRHPTPVVLRTLLKPLDGYMMKGVHQTMEPDKHEIKTYFIKIPAHKFLHIRNYKSIGYWDFWQKQSEIPGQDCETICGLLDSIKGKLDDIGGSEEDASSGQLMAFINAPNGRLCSWNIPLAEAYGVRLPMDYQGEIPEQMQLMEVQEGEYIVFEHGPFDFETENQTVEACIEEAMKNYDYDASGYALDLSPEKVFYFYHDCKRFWKYVRPVIKK